MLMKGESPFYERSLLEHESIMRSKNKDYRYDIPRLPAWVGITVIYPFHGAAARAKFYDRNDPRNEVSTYLDVEGNLGVMEHPYFEIYPAKDGDTDRFYYSYQEQMYPEILKSLKRQRKERTKDQ